MRQKTVEKTVLRGRELQGLGGRELVAGWSYYYDAVRGGAMWTGLKM